MLLLVSGCLGISYFVVSHSGIMLHLHTLSPLNVSDVLFVLIL